MDSESAVKVLNQLDQWAKTDPLLSAQLRAAKSEVNLQILIEANHELYRRIQELEAENVTHLDAQIEEDDDDEGFTG